MLNFKEIQEKNQLFFLDKKPSINQFEILSLMGNGSFSSVYKVKPKTQDIFFAMKQIKKSKIIQNELEEQLQSEIKILCSCQHENIITLYCAFEDEEFVYLLLEYADSGNLYQRLQKKKKFSEKIVAKYMACIIKAINHLHTRNPPIIHRDLKPENILIHQGQLKISDFGWSSQQKDHRQTFCGTYEYLSPEMIQGIEYNEKIDIWSLGIIMYELLTGETPFYPKNEKKLPIRQMQKLIEKNILSNKIQLDDYCSIECKEVLESMLQANPDLRPSAIELYTYKFFEKQGFFKQTKFRYQSFS